MRDIDRAFLKLFKDLKITQNKKIPETNGKPNYICYIGKQAVSNSDVVRMVKEYQDEIVKMLIEDSEA